MGTTFAHFSILDSNVEETIKFLDLIPKKPNALEIMKRISPKEKPFPESINDFKKPEKVNDEQWQKLLNDWPKFINTLKSQKRTYYIGKNNDWTTVFSEEFGLESIRDYALDSRLKRGKIVFNDQSKVESYWYSSYHYTCLNWIGVCGYEY